MTHSGLRARGFHRALRPRDPVHRREARGSDRHLRLRRRQRDFILYEDEGTNYNYEHGAFSEIPLHWDDTARTLTLGQRRGSFPECRSIAVSIWCWFPPCTRRAFRSPRRHPAHADYNGQAVTVDMK